MADISVWGSAAAAAILNGSSKGLGRKHEDDTELHADIRAGVSRTQMKTMGT